MKQNYQSTYSRQKEMVEAMRSNEEYSNNLKLPSIQKKCYLCLEEKLLILISRKKLLNKRSDLFNTCRHVTLNH